ncbi:MAG: hypothetical protein HS122_11680 [Opitutaceae bacterium]|nr:hypothetical protein [Opitutaceae bacterium]
MLKDGYLDATGVQDVHFEASQCVKAIMDLCSGVQVSEQILDNGFVIHQGNLDKAADRMWGAQKR